MKYIVTIIILLLTFITTITFGQVKPDTICSNASSQTEYYKCLSKEYARSDKDLNELYASLISKLGKKNLSNSINTLRESERSWINFKNKYSNVYEGLYKSGTAMPIVVLECQIRSIKNRIEELQALYDDINR